MRKNAFSPPNIILYLLLFLNDYLLADIFGGGTDKKLDILLTFQNVVSYLFFIDTFYFFLQISCLCQIFLVTLRRFTTK